MKNIVIIGAGGVGREVSLIIQQINELEPTWNLLCCLFLPVSEPVRTIEVPYWQLAGNRHTK